MDTPTLHGLHHVSAFTADAASNLDFYTRVLGMRLVKKTVNQDDTSVYHLFYADAEGSPGTELTFFEWKHVPSAREGVGTISETALRVAGDATTLEKWADWFKQQDVTHGDLEAAVGTHLPSLPFQDHEGQRLRLVAEPRATAGELRPWRGSPLGLENAVVGLSAVTLTVDQPAETAEWLTRVLGFKANPQDSTLLELGAGGPNRQLRLAASKVRGTGGAGGVHHVAWAVTDVNAQAAWLKHLAANQVMNSGLIDRHYFQSVYFRIPGGILFELATNGPGFTADGEPMETLGEKLSLPPFLEKQRASIESHLAPLESSVN
ncbi:MAG: ring-cleaving dioxygenase [Chthoniobacteraceae bacterium]